jgi:hypothetical protein
MVVGDWLVAIEAERHRNCQIPPDLVVKSQVIDIVEAIGGPISGETSSKGRVATGTQGGKLVSTSKAQGSTTQSDGRWKIRRPLLNQYSLF